MKKGFVLLICAMIGLFLFPPMPAANAGYDELPAFPGAEGFGYAAKGGRGGEVYHVTSYELTGPGTFHDALMTAGETPRTIVFDISGEITIPQIVVRGKSNITIAGQTAPGDGVTIRGNNIRFIDCSDIVIRYLRFRMGVQEFNDDSMYFEDCRNVIIDHSSFSWGTDEVLSIKSKDYDNPRSKNITVQWSIISEGLLTHSMGGLIEMNTITMHHNLYAHNNDRNPKTKGQIDFVNNIVYNWGGFPYVAGGESGTKGYGNVVGNYFIAGINSAAPQYAVVRGNENYSLYLENNRIDSNKNGVLDGTDTGSGMMEAERPSVLVPERFEYPPVHTQDPETAYEYILDYAGASLVRDAVDRRVTDDVRNQTGAIIGHENDVGGFPALARGEAPPDTDRDGMPDAWELANGLDPADPEDRNGDRNGDGYTNLEDYLNELAAPGFPEGYPMEPPAWSGMPFEPPVVPAPEPPEPEPAPALNGETVRSVVVNDNSGNGVVNASRWSVESDLKVGDLVAGDRLTGSKVYKFVTIPEEVLGAEWIRSAVESRSASNDDLLSFYTAAEVDVYVAHDSRITTKPQWLAEEYEDTGLEITDDQPVKFELYKKRYPAGSYVVMGPNGGSTRMNYFVILKLAAPDEVPPAGAPSGLAAESAEGPSASLHWTPVDGADAYLVYRSSTFDPHEKAVGSTDAASFADTNVELGVSYRYKVSAVNAGGESTLSVPVELLVYDASQPAPPAPADLKVEAERSLSVELSWSAVEEAVGYAIYRSEEGPEGPYEPVGYSRSTAFVDRSVSPSTAYHYRVTAMGAGGESAPSESAAAATKPPAVIPAAPDGLSAAGVTTSAFELAWNAVEGAESYNIYRKADGEESFAMIGTAAAPGFVDQGVDAGKSGYVYRVSAVNEMGESELSDELAVAMPLPEAPTDLLVGLRGGSFAGLIWTSHGGATQYNIYRSSAGEDAALVGTAKVDTFYDRTVKPGTEYTYFVKASNGAGESEPSNSVTVRTLPADTTPPVTTTDAKEGWQRTAQVVNLFAEDPEGSPVSTYYSLNDGPFVLGSRVTIDGEGVHTLRYYSVDAAGNEEDIRSVTVRIDWTGPDIQSSVAEVVYRFEPLSIAFDIEDALSGVEQAEAVLDGSPVDLPFEAGPYALTVGEHRIEVTAVDHAGNVAVRSVELDVRIELDVLDDALQAAYDRGWIDNRGILQSLLVKVNQLQDEDDPRKIEAGLRALERQISALAGKRIDADFARHFLEDLAVLSERM